MGVQFAADLVGIEHDRKNPVIEKVRVAPDFAVIDSETKAVHLIEVIYMKSLYYSHILIYARKMHDSWDPSCLFVATPDGFYFDDVAAIITNDGKISPLVDKHIPRKLQDEYLKMLRNFEFVD